MTDQVGVREGMPMGEVAFERYRLPTLIGERGMGKVYKAHGTMIDGGVAIKALPTEPGTEPGYRQRFHREAHTAARLTEPHSIPIYDTGDIDGRPYLVLPIIDVHGLLQRDGPMNPTAPCTSSGSSPVRRMACSRRIRQQIFQEFSKASAAPYLWQRPAHCHHMTVKARPPTRVPLTTTGATTRGNQWEKEDK